jgi:hypothetical protein
VNRNVGTKIAYGSVALLSLILNFALSGAVIATVNFLQLWAYPVMFLMGLGLIAFVLVILIPPKKKGAVDLFSSWRENLQTEHTKRMEKGIWKWASKRGAPVLIFASTLILSPFVGALIARFMGLDEHRAWRSCIVSTAVATVIVVSVYLGLGEWFRNLLS